MGALTLGDVIFSDFEIPEQISIGGRQQLVIHSLPGGRRVVDAMGGEDSPIRWSGVFSGPQVAERVRLLERMRRDGRRYDMAWNAWKLPVILQEFEARLTSSTWAPYKIQLCILSSSPETLKDWLDDAKRPELALGVLTLAGAESAINLASIGLGSESLATAVEAAGQTAQLNAARVFGLF